MLLFSKNLDIIQNYLDAFDTFQAGSANIYCSCPITGGPRYVDWFKNTGKNLQKNSQEYTLSHLEKVIIPNKKAAKSKTKTLLKNKKLSHYFGCFNIINPAVLDNLHFSQDDYLYLWQKVIEKYCRGVVFCQGWEMSFGCLYEYWVAQKSKIGCYNSIIHVLGKSTAIHNIGEAKMKMGSIWNDSYEQIFNEIKNV